MGGYDLTEGRERMGSRYFLGGRDVVSVNFGDPHPWDLGGLFKQVFATACCRNQGQEGSKRIFTVTYDGKVNKGSEG